MSINGASTLLSCAANAAFGLIYYGYCRSRFSQINQADLRVQMIAFTITCLIQAGVCVRINKTPTQIPTDLQRCFFNYVLPGALTACGIGCVIWQNTMGGFALGIGLVALNRATLFCQESPQQESPQQVHKNAREAFRTQLAQENFQLLNTENPEQCTFPARSGINPDGLDKNFFSTHEVISYSQEKLKAGVITIENRGYVLPSGFNALCNVLDAKTLPAGPPHSFLLTAEQAHPIIEQLKDNGHKIDHCCLRKTENLYIILTSSTTVDGLAVRDREVIDYFYISQSYRVQFQQCLGIARENPRREICFKAAVFEAADPKSIVEAFCLAALEYQQRLKEANIKVQLQLYTELDRKVAGFLRLRNE